jgi:hypothetical protein
MKGLIWPWIEFLCFVFFQHGTIRYEEEDSPFWNPFKLLDLNHIIRTIDHMAQQVWRHVFSSPELRAQTSLSDCCCPYVCMVDLYIFGFFSRTTGPVLTMIGANHRVCVQNCSNEQQCPCPRGDTSKRVKIHWKCLNIFSRTRWPIWIKLSIHHPWIKRIKFWSAKGPGPLQRRDNHKKAK